MLINLPSVHLGAAEGKEFSASPRDLKTLKGLQSTAANTATIRATGCRAAISIIKFNEH